MIYRLIGGEISVSSANTVANTRLVRVLNTGATAQLHIANTSGEYANMTLLANQDIIIKKQYTDTLTGNNMLAVPVDYED